jgi:predicted amidohydrolase
MSGIPIEAIAVELPGEAVFGPIMDFCARHGVWAATSTQETVPAFPGRFFHTGVIFGPEGLTLRSPKAQAYSVPSVTSLRDIKADYEAIYGPDSVLPVADTPIGRLGILVENEGVVPEAARLLARKGAQVILNPTIVRRDGPPMRAIGQTHAFCTGVWWLTASASRVAEPTIPQAAVAFDGESFIAAPGGQVIADCGPEDGFTTATIELHRVAESQQAHARETTPAGILYEDLYRSLR